MRVAIGTVVSGKVVLDDPAIADGTDVYVLAELEAGIAEADRGDMISGEAFFKHLRRHG